MISRLFLSININFLLLLFYSNEKEGIFYKAIAGSSTFHYAVQRDKTDLPCIHQLMYCDIVDKMPRFGEFRVCPSNGLNRNDIILCTECFTRLNQIHLML